MSNRHYCHSHFAGEKTKAQKSKAHFPKLEEEGVGKRGQPGSVYLPLGTAWSLPRLLGKQGGGGRVWDVGAPL